MPLLWPCYHGPEDKQERLHLEHYHQPCAWMLTLHAWPNCQPQQVIHYYLINLTTTKLVIKHQSTKFQQTHHSKQPRHNESTTDSFLKQTKKCSTSTTKTLPQRVIK